MNNQQTSKANWVKSFNIGDGTRVYVSDKGAFKLTTIQASGEEKFLMCLTPAQAKILVNASGDIGNFLMSDEYKAIEQNKVLVKEREKIANQMHREREKAARNLQASIDKLKALGVAVELPKQA